MRYYMPRNDLAVVVRDRARQRKLEAMWQLGDAQQLPNRRMPTWQAGSIRVSCAVGWVSSCATYLFSILRGQRGAESGGWRKSLPPTIEAIIVGRRLTGTAGNDPGGDGAAEWRHGFCRLAISGRVAMAHAFLLVRPLDEASLGRTAQITAAHVGNDPVPGVRAGSGLVNGMEAELLPVDVAPFKALADGRGNLVSVLLRIGLPVVGPRR